jgi:hypothetical protein
MEHDLHHTPEPPDHPQALWSHLDARGLRRLARRAWHARRRGPEQTERLAAHMGVTPRQLRLLADAWDEAGPSGVDALGPAPPEVDPAMQQADGALEAWRRHYPLESLQWDVWRNRVTVWLLEPGPDRRGDVRQRPLLQLRCTAGGRWHLYRKAAQGEWWPVTVSGPRRPQRLEDCLNAARVDGGNVFWGARNG